jgi:hypothetical protein
MQRLPGLFLVVLLFLCHDAPNALSEVADPGLRGDTIIVFDGSGSMAGKVAGTQKLHSATRAFKKLVEKLDPTERIGFFALAQIPPARTLAPSSLQCGRRDGACFEVDLIAFSLLLSRVVGPCARRPSTSILAMWSQQVCGATEPALARAAALPSRSRKHCWLL